MTGPQRNPRPNLRWEVLAALALVEQGTAEEVADLLCVTRQLAGHYLRWHRSVGNATSRRHSEGRVNWMRYSLTPAGRDKLGEWLRSRGNLPAPP